MMGEEKWSQAFLGSQCLQNYRTRPASGGAEQRIIGNPAFLPPMQSQEPLPSLDGAVSPFVREPSADDFTDERFCDNVSAPERDFRYYMTSEHPTTSLDTHGLVKSSNHLKLPQAMVKEHEDAMGKKFLSPSSKGPYFSSVSHVSVSEPSPGRHALCLTSVQQPVYGSPTTEWECDTSGNEPSSPSFLETWSAPSYTGVTQSRSSQKTRCTLPSSDVNRSNVREEDQYDWPTYCPPLSEFPFLTASDWEKDSGQSLLCDTPSLMESWNLQETQSPELPRTTAVTCPVLDETRQQKICVTAADLRPSSSHLYEGESTLGHLTQEYPLFSTTDHARPARPCESTTTLTIPAAPSTVSSKPMVQPSSHLKSASAGNESKREKNGARVAASSSSLTQLFHPSNHLMDFTRTADFREDQMDSDAVCVSCSQHTDPDMHHRQRSESYQEISLPKDVVGRVMTIAKLQSGSRYLQRLLCKGQRHFASLVFSEVADHIADLMVDPYGNYFCQQLFQASSPEQREHMVEHLSADILQIACDRRGTHSLQTLVSLMKSSEEETRLIHVLHTHILQLSLHPHGTHVIQKVLSCFHEPATNVVLRVVIDNLEALATNPHGLCVVKKAISAAARAPDTASQRELLRRLTATTLPLIQSPFGNYAIQHALHVWGSPKCDAILHQIKMHIVELSAQKFSSNAVEKAIEIADDAYVTCIIDILAQTPTMSALMQSSYGSFVVHKVLERATPEQTVALFISLNGLRRTCQGKRLKAKWDRVFHAVKARVEEPSEYLSTSGTNYPNDTRRTTSGETLSSVSTLPQAPFDQDQLLLQQQQQ